MYWLLVGMGVGEVGGSPTRRSRVASSTSRQVGTLKMKLVLVLVALGEEGGNGGQISTGRQSTNASSC